MNEDAIGPVKDIRVCHPADQRHPFVVGTIETLDSATGEQDVWLKRDGSWTRDETSPECELKLGWTAQERPETRYGVWFRTKAVKPVNGTQVGPEAHDCWLVSTEDPWVSAIAQPGERVTPPAEVLAFCTPELAREFVQKWKPHPWFAKPETYSIVPLAPVMKLELSHYETLEAHETPSCATSEALSYLRRHAIFSER